MFTILLIAAIAQHPSAGRVARPDLLARLVRLATIDRWVHATVIVSEAGSFFALYVFSIRRGFVHNAVTAALVAYGVAGGALIAAGFVDGFLIPQIVERYAGGPPQTTDVTFRILGVYSDVIQLASKLGFVATAAAIVSWSAHLLRSSTAFRAVGILGVVTALVLAITPFAVGTLNPHVIGIIVLLQSAWYIWLGALMVRAEL